ncbi:ferrous iron transport protein B [Blattabacterium cuenoti]|uniref:ferrous iron transport protein B n=1 Tax=Blattabacterium cuenoti TaxID=1653831 RepID=UPI001EEAE853|nr:ferrous iron transport protein B [Blattabacterium cuenoti]
MKKKMMQRRNIKLALLGNPNVGKTSLFNKLTGLNQKVGNYLGVTVDKKIGYFFYDKINYQIIDLPGTYSIYPSSDSEKVINNLLLENIETPDHIIFVIDSSNLKKSLLLFRQLQDLGFSILLLLNMLDEAKRKGIYIKIKKLKKFLKTEIILIDARKGIGLDIVKKKLKKIRNKKKSSYFFNTNLSLSNHLAIKDVKNNLKIENIYKAWYYLACNKIFLNKNILLDNIKKKYNIISKRLQVKETLNRYEEIKKIFSHTVYVFNKKNNQLEFFRKIDNLFVLHNFWGYVIFSFFLFFIFQSIFFWAETPIKFIELCSSFTQEKLNNTMYSGHLKDFLLQGILPGISTVISFIPQIFILLFFILLMEESGYINRVIFLMDKIMRPFGLNGRSIVPIISAMACSIPAIISSKHIENPRDRLITILMTPFMTCSAKLPIYTLIISSIIPNVKWGFVQLRGIVLMGMYIIGILCSFIIAILLHKYLKKNYDSCFIMELPTYKIPTFKNVFISLWIHIKSFILNTGKIILLVNVLIWVLGTFGPVKDYNDKKKNIFFNIQENELDNSYLGIFGKKLEPIIIPLGYDWKIGIGILSSIVAREVFVSTMNSLYKLEEKENKIEKDIKKNTKLIYSFPTGISLLFFYAFSMQCISTISIIKRETKSWKWPILQFLFMTTLAYIFSFFIYHIFK